MVAKAPVSRTPEDFLKDIKEKEDELANTTWSRYDADRDLILKPFRWQMPNEFGQLVDVAGASHITIPLAGIYLLKTNAIMLSSKMVLQAKGRDSKGSPLGDTAKGIIVDFCERILKMGDTRLTGMGEWPLKPWWVEQINWRGAISGRICLTTGIDKNGKTILKVKITPWDVRFTAPEFNEENLEWISYQTTRTKKQVRREYGEDFSGDVIVRDGWLNDKNFVFGNDRKILEQKNPYDKVPSIFKYCQSGTMLQDALEDVWKARGESIFAPVRVLYPIANETASLLQSLSIRAYKPAYTLLSKDGNILPDKPLYTPGRVTSLAEGQEVKDVTTGDIKNATQMIQSIVHEVIETGSISSIDMGNLSFPESSLVIQKLIDNRNQILVPRLNTVSEGYSELLRLAIDQYISLDQSMELGQPGDMKEFKPSDLEGDYDVVCELHAVYPEQNIADLSLANAQKGDFPKKYIMENTYKQKDADNMIRDKDIENAEASIPAFAYLRLAHQLMEEGKEEEAKLLAKMGNLTLQAMLSGNFDPNKVGNIRGPIQNDNLTATMAGQNTGTSTKPAQAQTNRNRQSSVNAGSMQ